MIEWFNTTDWITILRTLTFAYCSVTALQYVFANVVAWAILAHSKTMPEQDLLSRIRSNWRMAKIMVALAGLAVVL